MPTQSKQVKLSFSQWLKLRRDIAELKQADIAKALNVSNQAVSSWEKDIAKPALNPLQTQQLCLVLNVTFDELVKAFKGEVEIKIS